ncbi:MAG: GntR family transcriptional regulator, partial [Solirubrobacterales bacterium]|nr:GntR family transcriptional regulator [Solirubrobacterales bacterium]
MSAGANIEYAIDHELSDAGFEGHLSVTPSLDTAASLEAVFAPVHSLTAFEETVDRLGTAIRLGLLPPGTRLPAERELCTRL